MNPNRAAIALPWTARAEAAEFSYNGLMEKLAAMAAAEAYEHLGAKMNAFSQALAVIAASAHDGPCPGNGPVIKDGIQKGKKY